jgi:flavorubredoxin
MPSAVVVHDSWYGCTKAVGEEIARGLSADGRVGTIVVHVRDTTPQQVLRHDVIVIGSPNHFGAPTVRTRELLRQLRTFDLRGKRVAFFDTCFASDRGKARGKMEAFLRERNPFVSPPFLGLSVVVEGTRGPVLPGEMGKARELGHMIRTSLPIPA